MAAFGWPQNPFACRSRPLAGASKSWTALGNRLFERTTRRVTLTLYGQNFAERSEQLLAHVETVLADISQVSKARTGLVTVATVPSAAYYFMPEIIRSFQARYPQVRIRLIDSSVGNVIEAVSSGQADFGLCFAKNLPASIEFTPLADDRYVAACRRSSAGRQDAPQLAGIF
jgi:DNA-binding transcriptional LysR family regulator